MILTYRPIDQWPGARTPDYQRRSSPFGSEWHQTLHLLDRELRQLGAEHVVLMIDVPESDFRLDGDLRANARLGSPAVVLAFDSRFGSLKYACDKFTKWKDNVRAIALGLEALRKVERYGIGSRGEQYTGWKALPSGLAMGEPMSKAEAARVLVDLAGPGWYGEDGPEDLADMLVENPGGEVESAYRYAAGQHHPDKGGDSDLMARATEARDVLLG